MGSGYFAPDRPRLFGHRGAAGVVPENTMESFRRALADGAGYLELDVHATRDGAIVVIHDATVDRTTDGTGAVRDATLAELGRLDAGFRFSPDGSRPYRGRGLRIPTLAEVCDGLPGVPLNVEIKQSDPPIEAEVVRVLGERGALARTMLAAEDDRIMKRIRSVAPEVSTSLSAGETREFFERCFAGGLDGYRPPGLALQIPPRFGDIDLVTPETVREARRLGIEVHVWTINERAEMDRLLDMGVDGLMSDFPAELVASAACVRGPPG